MYIIFFVLHFTSFLDKWNEKAFVKVKRSDASIKVKKNHKSTERRGKVLLIADVWEIYKTMIALSPFTAYIELENFHTDLLKCLLNNASTYITAFISYSKPDNDVYFSLSLIINILLSFSVLSSSFTHFQAFILELFFFFFYSFCAKVCSTQTSNNKTALDIY